jgi:XTP/dITP diphosphohydrolase
VSRRLLIATTNPGKIREVEDYLHEVPGLKILSLRDLPSGAPIPETGETFEENAVAKAVGYSREFDGLTLADDSGICVDALGGAPGVESARFGGPGLDDDGRNRHLLERLREVPEAERTARYECVLALAAGGGLIATFEGKVEGRLLTGYRGSGGFGYDPLFLYEAAGRTFGELSLEEKARVSHRGRALAALRDHLLDHPDLVGEG